MALTILFSTEGDSHGTLIFISLRRKLPVGTLLIKTASSDIADVSDMHFTNAIGISCEVAKFSGL